MLPIGCHCRNHPVHDSRINFEPDPGPGWEQAEAGERWLWDMNLSADPGYSIWAEIYDRQTNEENTMGNINDLVPSESRFLKKDDIGDGLAVTIAGFKQVNAGTETEPQEKGAVFFNGIEKPLVLNATNRDLLILFLGTEDTDQMKGKAVKLWFDQTISFKGKITGGIRIAEADGQDSSNKPDDDTTGDIPF